MNDALPGTRQSSQFLHLVVDGVPKDLQRTDFCNPAEPGIVSCAPTRTFIVHLHRLLDPAFNWA